MKRHFQSAALVGAVLTTTLLPCAHANQMSIAPLSSTPADGSTKVHREQGLKGILVAMVADNIAAFPIKIDSATVKVQVGINNSVVCTTSNTVVPSPPQGACGAVVGTTVNTGDSVKVYYNGTVADNGYFPANTVIVVTVSGAVGSDNTTQGAVPPSISFTTGSNTPRSPVSIEAVFDTSGSMAWNTVITNPQQCVVGAPPPPNGPVCRIDTLKAAFDFFITPFSSYTMLGDKIGDVFFNTSAQGGGLGGGLLAAHDPNNIQKIRTDVQGASPGGWTAIGCGLAQAYSASSPYATGCNPALTSSGPSLSGDSNPRQVVVLFTDGEQNTPSLIQDNPPPPPLKVAGTNYPSTINVCPITMGTQSAKGFALLQAIASASCNGHNLYITNATTQTLASNEVNQYFAQQLQTDVLLGDKLEIVRNSTGTLPASVVTTTGVIPSTAIERFPGNSRDTSLGLILTWSGSAENERGPQLRLTAPDGTVIDLTGKVQASSRMRFYKLHFPLRQGNVQVDPKGQWMAEISAVVPKNATLNYQLIIMADNESIATDTSVSATDPGTGDSIPIEVRVMEAGTPVTGATVIAQINGPDNGLGDALAKAANPSGTPNANGDLVGSAANGKLILLLNDPNFIALLKNSGLPQVTLTDPGNTGVYRGTFNGAVKEGHYQFTIYIAGSTSANGNFERTRKLSLFVRPKPDPASTDLILVSLVPQADGTALAHIRATPRDRFGSFLGPDYLPQLDITCSGSACLSHAPIEDDLHGSYDVTYKLSSASSNPAIGLVVMGQKVKEETLSDLKKGYGGKWVASLHLGATIPHNNLTGFSSSVSLGGDLEYHLNTIFSLETYLGYDRFSASVGSDFRFVNLSGRFKATFGAGKIRPFVFAGIGGYFPSAGDTHFGISTGAGLQDWLKPRFAVEASYNFHNVFISGGDVRYSTALAGVRFVLK